MIDAKTQMKKTHRRTRGQGMTEYIVIVALIAVAAIGVVTLFGDNIRKIFGASAAALGGATNVATGASTSTTNVAGQKNLTNFGNNNAY